MNDASNFATDISILELFLFGSSAVLLSNWVVMNLYKLNLCGLPYPQNTAKITYMKILLKKLKKARRKKPVKVYSEFYKRIFLFTTQFIPFNE